VPEAEESALPPVDGNGLSAKAEKADAHYLTSGTIRGSARQRTLAHQESVNLASVLTPFTSADRSGPRPTLARRAIRRSTRRRAFPHQEGIDFPGALTTFASAGRTAHAPTLALRAIRRSSR